MKSPVVSRKTYERDLADRDEKIGGLVVDKLRLAKNVVDLKAQLASEKEARQRAEEYANKEKCEADDVRRLAAEFVEKSTFVKSYLSTNPATPGTIRVHVDLSPELLYAYEGSKSSREAVARMASLYLQNEIIGTKLIIPDGFEPFVGRFMKDMDLEKEKNAALPSEDTGD